MKTAQRPQSVRQLGGFVSIAVDLRRCQRPTQIPVRQQGQQKCSHKLPLCQPDRIGGLPRVKREDIHKNCTRSVEKDIKRGSVFQQIACRHRLAAQVQRQFGGGPPLGGRPFPWIGGEKHARVVDEYFALRSFLDLSCNHLSGGLPGLGQGGPEEAQRAFALTTGSLPAASNVCIKGEINANETIQSIQQP